MLSELLAAVADPGSAVPRAAKRLGVLFALALLSWSAVFAGLVGLVFAGHAWLLPRAGGPGSWAIAATSVLLIGALGIWLSTRTQPSVEPNARVPLATLVQLIDQHPVEAVCVAGVTGVLASSANLGELVDQVIARVGRFA